MSRIIVCVFLYLFIGFNYSTAQNISWVKKGISEGFEYGNAITCDDSGNTYVTGQIEFTAVFDNFTVSSNGSHDIFTAKYNTNGVIQWIKRAGGSKGDVGNGIGIDAAHNSYVAGEMEETVTFSSGATITSDGSNDIFLAKYSSGGTFDWVKRWGDNESDKALSIAVSPSGDCYLTGYFGSSVDFGNTTLHSSGSRDIFIMKVNSSGTVQWVKKAGGSGHDVGESICLDKDGNIYVAGSFSSTAYFGSTRVSNSGDNSAFIAKYNSNGSLQWVIDEGTCCGNTIFQEVFVDNDGNIYGAGYFDETTRIGSITLNSTGDADMFVAKYNSSGSLQWAKQGGGVSEDMAYGVNVDTINRFVYVTGNVSSNGSFGNLNYSYSGYRDIFVVAYDYSGNELWMKINGGSKRDKGLSITTDKLGYIYSTGIFNHVANFDSHTISGYPNHPLADFYINKITASPAVIPSSASSVLRITPVNCADFNVNFVPGNGAGRIVLVRQSSPVNAVLQNGIMYNANSTFGSGDNLNNGNYVVYNGTSNNFTLTGLTTGVTYFFSVIEYNGNGATIGYAVNNALNSSATTQAHAINVSGLQSSVCNGSSLSLTASGANNFIWSPSTGLSATSGPNVIVSPSVSTTYTVSGTTTSGCSANTTFNINVDSLPVVGFPPLADICLNTSPVVLNTGSPSGGTYSGQGVINGIFNPAVSGPGIFSVTYTYTNTNGCSENNSSDMRVNSLPPINLGMDTTICASASVSLNAGSGFSSYMWSTGAASSSITIDSNGTGAGPVSVYVQVTSSNSCANSDTINILFDLCNGVDENDISGISIYPNPFSENITIASDHKFSFSIYDTEGRLVDKQMDRTGSVYTGQRFSPGIYFAEVKTGVGRKIFYILKSK